MQARGLINENRLIEHFEPFLITKMNSYGFLIGIYLMVCLVCLFRMLNELGCTPFQYYFQYFFNWWKLSTIWNWLRNYEYEVITYRLQDKHNCKTSANHILFHFLKNKQKTLGTSINNLTHNSVCTKLKCNVIKACSPLHVYYYTTEKAIQLGTVQLPTPKGVYCKKR